MSVWLTDLADILREAGVPVIEETYNRGPYKGRSWKQVGFGGRGLSAFNYILLHHDASPEGPQGSPGALEWVKYMDIAPAAAAWVCVGCGGKHLSGTWHVYAAGLSNHAGTGGPWSPKNGLGPYVPRNGMNAVSWGIETDHTYGESWEPPYKQQQLHSIRRGIAAVLRAYRMKPSQVIRHLDWTNGLIDGVPRLATYGRKNDIDGLDWDYERSVYADEMAAMSQKERRLKRLERLRRGWRRRRNAIRASGKKAGLSSARTKIRSLNKRIKALRG